MMIASTTLLVPEQHLARVAGLNQALYSVIAIVAPPLGQRLFIFISQTPFQIYPQKSDSTIPTNQDSRISGRNRYPL
jgi:hypothetical protein